MTTSARLAIEREPERLSFVEGGGTTGVGIVTVDGWGIADVVVDEAAVITCFFA